MLEEQYDRGCRNPFLYLEAWQMVTEDISLLRRLSGFWVQVFLFAGKRSLLTEELSMRLAYLSGYEKGFPEVFTWPCARLMSSSLQMIRWRQSANIL